MKKYLIRFLEVIFVIITSLHIGLFINEFLFGFTIGPLFAEERLTALSLPMRFLFVGMYLIGIPAGIFFCVFVEYIGRRILEAEHVTILRLSIIDSILLLLFFSPFFYPYEGSLFYSLSENEKLRYLIIFIVSQGVIIYYIYYYLLALNEKKRLKLENTIRSIQSGNRKLSVKIKEDRELLQKVSDKLLEASKELESISHIPPEMEEYCNTLQDRFKIIQTSNARLAQVPRKEGESDNEM